MSTAAIIDIVNGKKTVRMYVHHDGYPDGQFGVVRALEGFFKGLRTTDPQEMADKFMDAKDANFHYTVTVDPKKRGRRRFAVAWKEKT